MKETLKKVLTPLFTRDMGQRMEIARMKLLLDQATVGARLGISQQQVSKIERGELTTTGTFTYFQLEEVFGSKGVAFILFGSYEQDYPRGHIHRTYWAEKLKKKREKKSGATNENSLDQAA